MIAEGGTANEHSISIARSKNIFGEYEGNSLIEENLIEELADTAMCIELLIDLVGKDKVMTKLDEKFKVE